MLNEHKSHSNPVNKLVVVIPCYQEEEHVAKAIRSIPRNIAGIDRVEVLVVDDGSTDRSVEEARLAGADHILKLGLNRGLARVFKEGLEAALAVGATVIVVFDADCQYEASCIPELITPVLTGKADLSMGVRPIDGNPDFSWVKKKLQRCGSAFVSLLCGQKIEDAVTGFRAYNREAALRLSVLNTYTYTVETLIQASFDGFRIAQIKIRVNPTERPSRLVKSMYNYIYRMGWIMLRLTAIYYPVKIFGALACIVATPGMLLGVRFLYFALEGRGDGHVQSLILCLMLILLAAMCLLSGLIAELTAANRTLIQEVLLRIKLAALFGEEGIGVEFVRRRYSFDVYSNGGEPIAGSPDDVPDFVTA